MHRLHPTLRFLCLKALNNEVDGDEAHTDEILERMDDVLEELQKMASDVHDVNDNRVEEVHQVTNHVWMYTKKL
jgi:uncharacterized protein YoxC